MDLTVGFVSRNLVAQTNFVKFRDNQNFNFFQGIGCRVTHGKPCVKMHVFTRHMASYVSTCMGFDLCINGEFTTSS